MSCLSKEGIHYLFWRFVIPYIIHAVQVICPTVVKATIQPTHVIFVQFIQHVLSQRSGRLLLVVLVAVHKLHRHMVQSGPPFYYGLEQLSVSQSCSLHAFNVQCTLYTADMTCDADPTAVSGQVSLTACDTMYIGTNIFHPSSRWKTEDTVS
jgi:hypothetical protein